ncbi:hypothetical protein V5P93_004990 [Actinokineospora auranticolor]|uniref:Uncharacterized protein n=1 Tax=Actinokineospora auranticolor TaxID=155976 RepID=A0A2S6GJW2_9PSEU|nr:hypothetical protein [Actinokineospora auranticolor]PPK65518.1 hypothetical protein CLV40_1131 [Actinokineospora auranticolor]
MVELYEIVQGTAADRYTDRLPATFAEPYLLDHVGTASARGIGAYRVARGSGYATDARVPRRVVPIGVPVVTMFVKFACRRPDATVLIDRGVPVSVRQGRRFTTLPEARAFLGDILGLWD